MANNYYDATGVLVLDQVTPVITALFGGLKLDASYPGNGEVYIAQIAEDSGAHWDDVCEDPLHWPSRWGCPCPARALPRWTTFWPCFPGISAPTRTKICST